MTLIKQTQWSFPAWCTDEIRNDEYKRTSLDLVQRTIQKQLEICERRLRQTRLFEHIVDETQDLYPPASRRNGLLDRPRAPKHHRPHSIPVTCQQARDHRHEIHQHGPLLIVDSAKIH